MRFDIAARSSSSSTPSSSHIYFKFYITKCRTNNTMTMMMTATAALAATRETNNASFSPNNNCCSMSTVGYIIDLLLGSSRRNRSSVSSCNYFRSHSALRAVERITRGRRRRSICPLQVMPEGLVISYYSSSSSVSGYTAKTFKD